MKERLTRNVNALYIFGKIAMSSSLCLNNRTRIITFTLFVIFFTVAITTQVGYSHVSETEHERYFHKFYNITGSTVSIISGNPITAATPGTVGFQVNVVAPDNEYVLQVVLSAPSGWMLTQNNEDATSSSGRTQTVSVSGSGTNSITYTITATSSSTFPGLRNGETWGIDVDVTAPGGTSGSQTINYTLNGDNFGSPPHSVSGTMALDVNSGGGGNLSCSPSATQITGTVFEDFNYNGTFDSGEHLGVEGVSVTATDSLGNTFTAGAGTDANGDFVINGLTAGRTYRVEFSNLPSWGSITFYGGDNGTSVQFVQPGNCANLGVANPTDYCQEDPLIVLACYENGAPANNTNKGIVSFQYSVSGSSPAPGEIAKVQDVGSIWGTAYQQSTQKAFFSAFMKRHSDFGNAGSGGVYMTSINPVSGVATTVSSFDLQGVVPSNGGSAIDFGNVNRTVVPGPISAGVAGDNEISLISTEPNRDMDALDKVGKISYGNIEYNSGKLYLINLFEPSLIVVDVDNAGFPLPTNGTNPASNIVERYLFNSLSGLPNCNNGQYRPFAISFYEGQGYIGGVCSGENGGTINDVIGYVHRFDPLNIASGFIEILSFSFDYNREPAATFGTDIGEFWAPWQTGWSPEKNFADNGADPQPIISDIEFTRTGDMVLGIMDRFSHQGGHENYESISGNTQLFNVNASGDILHVCLSNGTYFLEGTTECPTNDSRTGGEFETNDGPFGVGEFYCDDFFDVNSGTIDPSHLEVSLGGLALLPGTDEVVNTVYDPLSFIGTGEFRTQGIHWYSTQTGKLTDSYKVVESSPNDVPGGFGKAAGLAEAIFICSPAPLEIGNYVWCDSISNGIQDPFEQGIDGMLVQLYDADGDLVGQDTTANGGQYYFNQNNVDTTSITVNGSGIASPNSGSFTGMSYAAQYYIVFGNGQFSSNEFTVGSEMYGITPFANVGSNDDIDSDIDGGSLTSGSLGSRPDGLPFITLTTNESGSGDHSFDLGLYCDDCEIDIVTVYSDNCSGSGPFTANWNISIEVESPSGSAISYQRNNEPVLTHTLTGNTDTLVIAGIPADGGIYDTLKVWFTNNPACSSSFILKRPLPCPTSVPSCTGVSGCLGGNVFNDFNCDGADAGTGEPGIQGVQVVIYDCDNIAIDTVYTDEEGDWQLCGLMAGEDYRVEFALPKRIDCWANPTHAGNDNGSNVQFAQPGACLHFGIADPNAFCLTSDDLRVITGCGNGPSAGQNTSIVSWNYADAVTSSGNGVTHPHDDDANFYTSRHSSRLCLPSFDKAGIL